MNRYAEIERAEDLGGIEMFPDLTEDLRPLAGQKEALEVGGHRPEGEIPATHSKEKEHGNDNP